MSDNTKNEIINNEENKELSPAEYFELVKSRIENETEENIKNVYNTTLTRLKRYMATGQKKAAKELYAKCLYLEKEIQLVRKGVTQYVLRTDIDKYIDKIANECVCIIELENFDREVPDEIIDIVVDTKEIFDNYFVVFTDYTGEARSKVEAEKRDKDPILFGNIYVDGMVSPKMYFIGDWIDDYCDLTLDKMIEAIAKKDKSSTDKILYNIDDYSNLDDIENALFGTRDRIQARTCKEVEGEAGKTKKTRKSTTKKSSTTKKTTRIPRVIKKKKEE